MMEGLYNVNLIEHAARDHTPIPKLQDEETCESNNRFKQKFRMKVFTPQITGTGPNNKT